MVRTNAATAKVRGWDRLKRHQPVTVYGFEGIVRRAAGMQVDAEAVSTVRGSVRV